MQAAEFERSIAGEGALPGRRFAIYRNNIAAALIDALAVRYPVIERLVGREFFSAMALDFARDHRPQSPVFARYGGEFPDFIEGFAPAASVPYLADVARLESAWWRAYHAADRTALPPDGFASIEPQNLAAMRFEFLPSSSIVRSRWPIVAIWSAHQGDGDLGHIDLDRGETAHVVRPGSDVIVKTITQSDANFIGYLVQGRSLGQAAEHAAGEPAFDLATALGVLIAGCSVSAIHKDSPS
jgi:hypothetical protein